MTRKRVKSRLEDDEHRDQQCNMIKPCFFPTPLPAGAPPILLAVEAAKKAWDVTYDGDLQGLLSTTVNNMNGSCGDRGYLPCRHLPHLFLYRLRQPQHQIHHPRDHRAVSLRRLGPAAAVDQHVIMELKMTICIPIVFGSNEDPDYTVLADIVRYRYSTRAPLCRLGPAVGVDRHLALELAIRVPTLRRVRRTRLLSSGTYIQQDRRRQQSYDRVFGSILATADFAIIAAIINLLGSPGLGGMELSKGIFVRQENDLNTMHRQRYQR